MCHSRVTTKLTRNLSKTSYYRRSHTPNARARPATGPSTLSLCAPGDTSLLAASAASLAPRRPSRPQTLPVGSARPPVADALLAPARTPRLRVANLADRYGVSLAAQEEELSSLSFTLSLSPSILAPAALQRAIES